MGPTSPHDEIVHRYKRRRSVVLWTLAIPSGALFLATFAGVAFGWAGWFVSAGFVGAFVLSVFAHLSLRCPVCRKLILDSDGGPNFRANKCTHCGIELV
jgi:hypothetical protein